jgi:hypothetical protein
MLEFAEDSEERLFLVFSLAVSLSPEKKANLSVISVRDIFLFGSRFALCALRCFQRSGGGPWSRTRNTGLQSVPLPLGWAAAHKSPMAIVSLDGSTPFIS